MTQFYTPQGLPIVRDPHDVSKRTFFHDLELSEEKFTRTTRQRIARQRAQNPHLFEIMDLRSSRAEGYLIIASREGRPFSDIGCACYWGGWSDCYTSLRGQGSIPGTKFTPYHMPIVGEDFLGNKISSQQSLAQKTIEDRNIFKQIEKEDTKLMGLMVDASWKRGSDIFFQALEEIGCPVQSCQVTYRTGFHEMTRILEEQEKINRERIAESN